MPMFSKVVGNVLKGGKPLLKGGKPLLKGGSKQITKEVDEPMVDEQMGLFGDIRIPVHHRPGSAQNWSAVDNAIDYVTPQTQDEHNSLLNKYYPYRKTMKNWKEMGRAAEKDSPHYSDTDKVIRKDIGARSSVIQDMAYNKTYKLAMLKMNGQWYTYSATPEEFMSFLQSGSLGREMNKIKHNKSTTMNKTAIKNSPSFNRSGSRIASLFGL